jgi:hypothetical protein
MSRVPLSRLLVPALVATLVVPAVALSAAPVPAANDLLALAPWLGPGTETCTPAGCADLPFAVDEVGDEMTGDLAFGGGNQDGAGASANLIMRSGNIIIEEGNQLILKGETFLGSVTDDPVELRVNNLPAVRLDTLEGSTDTSISMLGDVHMDANALAFAGGNLQANPDLTFNGDLVCLSSLPPPGCGTITGIEAGFGLLGGGAGGDVSIAANPDELQTRVADACAPGSAIRLIALDGTVLCDVGVGSGWGLLGNGGTTQDNFLGTLDLKPLELRVNNQRALLLQPTTGIPNLLGGDASNSAGPGAVGSVIGGGGENSVTNPYDTVAGGRANTAGAPYAVVPGGWGNSAQGQGSFAGGRNAQVPNGQHGAFVWSDWNQQPFSSTQKNEFAVRATGGVRFVSAIQPNGVPSAGVSLAPGAGAWSTLSDRNAKGFFEPVDGRDVLQQLAGLDVSTWTYNSQAPTIRHMGPVAQDFRAAFGLGESDTTISTVDADGVAFAAIQGLYAELQDRDARITALEHQNSVLEDRLAHIEAMLTQAGVGLPLL